MKHFSLLILLGLLTACGQSSSGGAQGQGVEGKWVMTASGVVMQNPQPSGLVSWRGRLLSVSDGSADNNQVRKLHRIRKSDAVLAEAPLSIRLSPTVKNSCFGSYLDDKPDLEALTVDPKNDRVFVVVTEDATRSGDYSFACRNKYMLTGSTDFPTLIARLYLENDGSLTMTHVRPIQFRDNHQVGDYPNDGIEALAFAPDGTLYLGLEKDKKGNARIFKVKVSEGFWQKEDFATVADAGLKLPVFDGGNHPINGMDFIKVDEQHSYLIAAARNDDELWIIDLNRQEETRRIKLHFLAPAKGNGCEPMEVMDNASIEGVAVDGQTLWLINDPWKVNYLKNIQCESNRTNYRAMAPLLFRMEIDPAWFE